MRLNNPSIIILFILSSITYFGLRANIDTTPHYFNDESFYQQMSLDLKHHNFIYSNLTGRWYLNSMGLKYTGHEHPPLHFILTSLFATKNLSSVRLYSIFCNYIILICIFLILTKLYDPYAGIMGATLWAIYPIALYLNPLNFPHQTFTMFALIFATSLVYNNITLSTIALGLSLLSQHVGFLLFIPYFIRFKSKSYFPLSILIVALTPYVWWQMDYYTLSQIAPTLNRFVYLIPAIIILSIATIALIFFKTQIATYWNKFKSLTYKTPIWISTLLIIYLFIIYNGIKPINLYDWYKTGVNVYYIGIIPLILLTPLYLWSSYLVIQLFLLILNRGDHMLMMVQPFIIIGLAIAIYKIYTSNMKLKIPAVFTLTLILVFPIIQSLAYIQTDTEDTNATIEITQYINSQISNTTCIMSMTKYLPYLNTTCKSDILLPIAYEYGDAVYRHFPDRSIFNQNISYLNCKYIISRIAGLEYLQQWGSSNNNSVGTSLSTIMTWQYINISNTSIFLNPKYQ